MSQPQTARRESDATNQRPFYRYFPPRALKEALRRMYLIRRFEEGAEESYMRGLIHGTMHLSIGQEASAVGACMDLRKTDYITSTSNYASVRTAMTQAAAESSSVATRHAAWSRVRRR